MNPEIDRLIAEVAALESRVAALESVGSRGEYVEGWANAARLLGVNERTCRRRYGAGKFCRPCKIDTIARSDGNYHERPTWRRVDLEAYAEGR